MKSKRARGDGSIYRRGDRWWAQYYSKGKLVRESTGVLCEKDPNGTAAARFLRKKLGQIDHGKLIDPSIAKRTRLTDCQEILQANYNAKGRKSRDHVKSQFARLVGHFGDCLVADLTSDAIDHYVDEQMKLNPPPAKGTVNRTLSALRRSLRLAKRAGKFQGDLPDFELMDESDNVRQGFLRPGDFERLLAGLPEDAGDAIGFLYWTGWRLGAMKTLEWCDVDLPARQIRLRAINSKTNTAQTLPIEGDLLAIINRAHARHQKFPHQLWVFLRTNGRRVGDLRGPWKKARKAAGLDNLTIHDLRRTTSRDLRDAGVPESIAMAQTGHKTAATYRRYGIVDAENLRNAAEMLRAFRASQTPEPQRVVPIDIASRTGTK